MNALTPRSDDDVPDQRALVPSARAYAGRLDAPDPLDHRRGRTGAIEHDGSARERADLRASFALDVARLHAAGGHPGDPWHDGESCAGAEPAAEIAGRVVVAAGRMRRGEG